MECGRAVVWTRCSTLFSVEAISIATRRDPLISIEARPDPPISISALDLLLPAPRRRD